MNLEKIKNVAQLVLDDNDFNKLINYLIIGKIHSARIMIDDIIENNELLLEVSSLIDVQDIRQDITNLKLIESEIFNLYERDDEREQIKQLVS